MAGGRKGRQKSDVVVDAADDVGSNDGSQPPTPLSEKLGMHGIQRALDITVKPNFESITASIKVMLSAILEIAKSMDFQARTFDSLLQQSKMQTQAMADIKHELGICKNENAALKADNEIMKVKVNDLEQYSKNFNIEIQGIPEKVNEDVYEIVTNVAQSLGCNVTANNIERCHRLRKNVQLGKKTGSPATIVAKFYSRQCKDGIVAAKRGRRELRADDIGFKNCNNNIFINDHLTSINKNLFWLARNAKTIGYKFAWTRNGKIFLRKDESSPVLRICKPSDIPAVRTI